MLSDRFALSLLREEAGSLPIPDGLRASPEDTMCQVVDDVALLRTPSCRGRACHWHSDLGLRRKGLNYLCSEATRVPTRSTHESQVQSSWGVWASSRGSEECHWMGWFIWTNSGRNLVTPDAGFSSFSSILLFQSAQTALFFHAWHLKSSAFVQFTDNKYKWLEKYPGMVFFPL